MSSFFECSGAPSTTASLWRQPCDIALGKRHPAAQVPIRALAPVNPDEASEPPAVHLHGGCTGTGECLGLLLPADAEHEAVLAGAAQHVVVEEKADAAEHSLFGDAAELAQGAAHAIGVELVVGHAAAKGPDPSPPTLPFC
jgi:hypothetical protein